MRFPCLYSRNLLYSSRENIYHSFTSYCGVLTWIKINVASVQVSSVQLLSRVQLFVTPWVVARQASLSITNSRSSPKLMSIESVIPSSHLILCHPLLLLTPIPLSVRVFSNESTLLIRWPKYWSFSFSISPSNEHPGLISFRMDWLDLLAVQGTLKSLLQHHSSKASILRLMHSKIRHSTLLCSIGWPWPCALVKWYTIWASQVVLVVKNLPANAGDARDVGLIPGLGRSPGEGNGNPLQYSCLENPMNRWAWWATVHRAAKSQTLLKKLSMHTQIVQYPS